LELRAKTDRQLLGLIHSKLQIGLNFVALAGEMSSDENTDHSEQLLWACAHRLNLSERLDEFFLELPDAAPK